MKFSTIAIAVLLAPICLAAADTFTISPKADWGETDRVADNIKTECDLPAFQADCVLKNLKEKGVAASLAGKDEIPAAGYYLQLRIVDAVSSGNAFMGHRKSVSLSTRLFLNGTEVSKTVKSRDSMGGVGAGFKGSCAVLRRCCEALGKDIAAWTAEELAKKK